MAASEDPTDSHQSSLSETLPGEEAAPLDNDLATLSGAEAGDDLAWSPPAPGGSGGALGEDGLYDLDQRLSAEPSLREHLLAQLALTLDGSDRLIGQALVDSLDPRGYLAGGCAELAQNLGVSEDRVERVLAALQACEPTGIGARDLAECLALQLAEKDRLDPAMRALLDNLELVAERDFTQLMTLCGVDQEDLVEMLAELRALDPKPAEEFLGAAAEPVVPDILMRRHPAGGWALELNPETLPRVLIDRSYHARIAAGSRSKTERDFLSERLQAANWLVKSLDQRATTILRVAGEIVRQQDGFFAKGIGAMRPLTLKAVAAELDLHESTVSRVTANKFMTTPRGTFELKYFFTAAIAGTDGGDHAASAVRHRIKDLIAAETPERVLSDDAIVTKLEAEGIAIARRTVAKYREALAIPSSVERRRRLRSRDRAFGAT